MPSITVKNIPEATYQALKQMASSHHRSMNSEILLLIEKATTSKQFEPQKHLSRAQLTREKTKKYLLTSEIVLQAKEDGRL